MNTSLTCLLCISNVSLEQSQQFSRLVDTQHTTQTTTDDILVTTRRIETSLVDLSINNSNIEAEVVQIRRETTSNAISLTSIDKKVEDLRRMMQSPQLLRSTCDTIQRIQSLCTLREQNNLSSTAKLGLGRVCHCRKLIQKELNQFSLASLRVFRRRTVISTHSPGCPYYYGYPESDSLSFGVYSYFQLLSIAIQISFETTRGAGGLSISTPLSLRSIMPDNSPAFALFDFRSNPQFRADRKGYIKDIPAKLQKLFRMREASPRDTDARGQTLMHASSLQPRTNNERLNSACSMLSRLCSTIQSSYNLIMMVLK
jgi:hypothetical protein